MQALCTSAPYYAAPEQFKLTGDTWTWEADWITPRFDFKQFRVGYVTTNTPAESADDLEGVIYTGTDTEAAVTPVAGRFYHVFADYDSHGGTGVARSSDPVVGSYVAL